MTAIGTLALLRAERLAVAADIVGAMTLEALKGSHHAFEARVHAARPQRASSHRPRTCGSSCRLSDRTVARRLRACAGRLSLRACPVHGAARDTFRFVREILSIEVNASTDNPMVFAERGDLVSAGTSTANRSRSPSTTWPWRRARWRPSASGDGASGQPGPLGTPRVPGERRRPQLRVHDGARHRRALVSENKVLAHPASVDTIPTSAGKEDHVSMGVHAARKAAEIVRNTETVLAIEALAAAQALDFLAPLRRAAAFSRVPAFRRASAGWKGTACWLRTSRPRGGRRGRIDAHRVSEAVGPLF